MRATPGVSEASGQVFSLFTLVGPNGVASTDQSEQVNVSGEGPAAANLSDSRTVDGPEAALGPRGVAAGELGEGE